MDDGGRRLSMDQRLASARPWATLSLLSGALWLILSVMPLFVTTLLGLPLAAVAFVSGLWAGRGQAASDAATRRRVRWGLGLGCAGCLWQAVYYSLMAGVALAAAPSLFDYLRQFFPTPAP